MAKKKYENIISDKEDWPVVKLSRDRKEFTKKVVDSSLDLFFEEGIETIRKKIELTIHNEKLRIKNNPWKVDPKDDNSFWITIQQRLVEIDKHADEVYQQQLIKVLVTDIMSRYANEIAGNFKRSYYRFASRLVKFIFARLLNAIHTRGIWSMFSKELNLSDRIEVVGEIEQLRELAQKGTVVIVPTHSSNLDSILIGWTIDYLGLPPMIYGAGLNLFNIKIIAYFMNSLGAFKVDRRKRNPMYLEVLKTYSRLAIMQGCHTLFFPGGTRSRSGKIEKELKYGLLNTTIQAQRALIMNGEENRKVFIVPLVLNYNFVLEAPVLIKDYLRKKGKSKYYVESDKFSTSYKIFTFLFKFFARESRISVSVGKAMDVIGNQVDMNGTSVDNAGKEVHVKDYFMSGKVVTKDRQREDEYVRVLTKGILKEYGRKNRIFASQLLAFTTFQYLKEKHDHLDFFELLRLTKTHRMIPLNDLLEAFSKRQDRIKDIYKEKLIDLDQSVLQEPHESFNIGIKELGLYHDKRPLTIKKKLVIVNDMRTLYFYRNRLDGYEI